MECLNWEEEKNYPREGDFLYQLNEDQDGIILMGSNSQNAVLEIPAVIAGLPVTAIGEGAFQNNTWLREVHLPDTITVLQEFAFDGCEQLDRINLPDGLQRIEMCALGGTRLTSVSVPVGTVFLGNYAFAGSDFLEEVLLSDHLQDMETNPFTDCPHLSRIHLSPDHPVFRLQDGLLFDQQRQITICLIPGFRTLACTVPEGVETIGAFTFLKHPSLRMVNLPESVRIIEDFSFSYCEQLRSIRLPAGLQVIEMAAMIDCRHLKQLCLPPNLQEIGDIAFAGCTFLTLHVRRGSASWKICRERGLPYRCSPRRTHPRCNERPRI